MTIDLPLLMELLLHFQQQKFPSNAQITVSD